MKADLNITPSSNGDELLRLRTGLLSRYIAPDAVSVSSNGASISQAPCGTIVAVRILQNITNYRAALQTWFANVRVGGHLVIVVPDAFLAERQLFLPIRDHPEQRRLYTPRSLMDEIEEALEPNSYRVRLLCEDDTGYDYNLTGAPQTGQSDILLAVEKIEQPHWALAKPLPDASGGPDYDFQPRRTRIETARTSPHQRILILKLDHLGDFIIGISALQRVRALFPRAHITLVVGSWNFDLARSLNVADEVHTFDAFPRNSSEEAVDVSGKRGLLEAALPEHYDLAIDLRTDADTRTLLGRVSARLKAGLGTRADHPFLDIALPIDLDRTSREAARETLFNHHAFHSQDYVQRLSHRAIYSAENVRHGSAIIWGPYVRLRAGRYLFDPFLEIAPDREGLLMVDIALETRRVCRRIIAQGDPLQLQFDVEQPDSLFEFRIWDVDEVPALPFSFFGGRLIRAGAPGELHQSDYLDLLVELIARRLDRVGLLTELGSI